jgi:hypothetical protein
VFLINVYWRTVEWFRFSLRLSSISSTLHDVARRWYDLLGRKPPSQFFVVLKRLTNHGNSDHELI